MTPEHEADVHVWSTHTATAGPLLTNVTWTPWQPFEAVRGDVDVCDDGTALELAANTSDAVKLVPLVHQAPELTPDCHTVPATNTPPGSTLNVWAEPLELLQYE